MDTVDYRLIEMALEAADSQQFEKFAQIFASSTLGLEFVPLGGAHDGGADGLIAELMESSSRPGRFMQASITSNHRAKIRHTARRLREYGRTAKEIIYITSKIVNNVDTEEMNLSDELDLSVRIRDQKYVSVHINDSQSLVQAYKTYLLPFLDYLKKFGSSSIISASPALPTRALCVFLGQQIEIRRGHEELLEAVTDGLILWSLEGTDPEKNIFLTRDEIAARVEDALPASKQFIHGNLDHRLERISSKDGPRGREIRLYASGNKYCLPYETRKIVELENASDEILKRSVTDVFRTRVNLLREEADSDALLDQAISACHRTLELTFERQGLEMAHFVLEDEPEEYITPSISDHLNVAVEQLNIGGNASERVREICMSVLRQTFYDSSESERKYLSKLSRTYITMFMLMNEPKIVEYFRSMSSEFMLLVGADIIIRALAEHFLEPSDKMTVNTLDLLKTAGATLILTDKALDEVWTHLESCDWDYGNEFAEIEPYMTFDLARQVSRILLRSYFYARLDRTSKYSSITWQNYVGSMCDYARLHSQAGRESLRNYLIERFGLEYEDEEAMEQGIDPKELEGVTDAILNRRKRKDRAKERLLARNDALHVLRVYSKRREIGEAKRPNPYGYRTWWLTHEVSVLRATAPVVKRHGSRYMMRPEFLVNFIGLAPSEARVRDSFASIFPTLLGIKLSNRMNEEALKGTLHDIKKILAVDEARAKVQLTELSNQLKSDFLRGYIDNGNKFD